MGTIDHDQRTQVIYLAGEIGKKGAIRSLALDVTSVPGQTLNNWTIRMKHTTLNEYTTAAWEGGGWTTVYQANETVSATGWRAFEFTTPFLYDGTSNLLIDFSFNNSSASTTGGVKYSSFSSNRTVYHGNNNAFGDPLSWSGTANPTPVLSTGVPNIRLEMFPEPTVTDISPDGGANNEAVTDESLTGSNFRAGMVVKLVRAGQAAILGTDVVIVDSMNLNCRFNLTGAAVGVWDVVVVSPQGQTAVLPGGFTIQDPAPSISSITPSLDINDGTVDITYLTGRAFQPGATVKLARSGQPDIIATNVAVVSSRRITSTFDLSGAVGGSWDVVVTNPDGQSGRRAAAFEINSLWPEMTGITPNSGPNSGIVNITNLAGKGFLPGVTVKLTRVGQPDIIATNITVVSFSKITCTVNLNSATPGDWDVVVINTDGKSRTRAAGFSVYDPRVTVSGITPNQGENNRIMAIANLGGSGFRPGVTVKLTRGGRPDVVASDVMVVTGSQITCTFNLNGAVAGSWDVIVANADGISGSLPGGFVVLDPVQPVKIPPGVSTGSATVIGNTSASVFGVLTTLGSASLVNLSIEYGSTNGLSSVSNTIVRTSTGASAFVLTGLSPGTTYQYRAAVESSDGSAVGLVNTFTTNSPPVLVTGNATSITGNSAVLNGSIADSGTARTLDVYYEYGPTDKYGRATYSIIKTTTGSFSINVAGLLPGTAYHFRARVDTGAYGTVTGVDMYFTTRKIPPTVSTVSADNITTTSATLTGNLSSMGTVDTAYVSVEYGATVSYGSTSVIWSKNALGAFSFSIGGLSPSTTYHFRALATSTQGIGTGQDMTFTTAVAPPMVATVSASSITATGATLTGNLTSLGSTNEVTALFEYGTSTAYGTTTQSVLKVTTGAFSVNVSGLAPGTLYHFRTKATGTHGTGLGDDMSFVTSVAQTTPSVTTLSAAEVASSTAILL